MYALTCLYRRDVQVCTKLRNGVNANDIPLQVDIWTKKKRCLKQYFPISYLSDMNDLAMTCRDYKNALNM